jgi:hypothetical protein
MVSMYLEAFHRIAGGHLLFHTIELWSLQKYVTLALYLDLLQRFLKL